MCPRRVLFIDLAPAVGGSLVSLYHLVAGLDRQRYEPHVALLRGQPFAERIRAAGVAVLELETTCGLSSSDRVALDVVRRGGVASWLKGHRWGERLVHLVGFYARVYPHEAAQARELGTALKMIRPDLVHLNDALFVNRPGVLAARRAGVRAICHVRSFETRSHYDVWLSRSLRGYICVSHAVEEHLQRQPGRTGPSWVVHNGLDLSEFDAAVTSESVRSEFGFTKEDVVLGSVGRLVPWKGHSVFLAGLADLARTDPRVRGLIVGAPEPSRVGYIEELRSLADRLGLARKVVFTGQRWDVPRLLKGMDILVHTSTAPEPFGRVLIEAMAAGTLVIASDAGGVAEIITDGVTGFMVPMNDEAALVQTAQRVLAQGESAHQVRMAARRCVEQCFTVQHYVRGVERVYEEIL